MCIMLVRVEYFEFVYRARGEQRRVMHHASQQSGRCRRIVYIYQQHSTQTEIKERKGIVHGR